MGYTVGPCCLSICWSNSFFSQKYLYYLFIFLEDGCLTMLCWFLLGSNENQP